MQNDPKIQLQNAIFYLLKTEPFYGHFVLNSTIVFDRFNVPTAGATIRNNAPCLIFNTKFMEDKTTPQYAAILKHEILHLMFEHTQRFGTPKPDSDPMEHKLWNIAMDCTINQYIKELPEGGITLELLCKETKKVLLPFQTSDYYYENLRQEYEKIKDLQTLDDHSVDQSEGMLEGMAAASAVIKAAAKKAAQAAAGNVSSDLLKIIEALNDSKLPWRQILKNFVLSKVMNKTRSTRKKSNRRFGFDAPGKVKKRTLKLGICVDSSGSIDDNTFNAFMSEVKQIINQGVEVILIDADCEVKNVQKIKNIKDFKPSRTGGGGTAYQPAIDECMKHNVTAIAYLGDFDSSDIPVNPGVPFLWVGVGNQPPPGNFGKVLRIL